MIGVEAGRAGIVTRPTGVARPHSPKIAGVGDEGRRWRIACCLYSGRLHKIGKSAVSGDINCIGNRRDGHGPSKCWPDGVANTVWRWRALNRGVWWVSGQAQAKWRLVYDKRWVGAVGSFHLKWVISGRRRLCVDRERYRLLIGGKESDRTGRKCNLRTRWQASGLQQGRSRITIPGRNRNRRAKSRVRLRIGATQRKRDWRTF